MTHLKFLCAALALVSGPAWAEIAISDAYLRTAHPAAKTGAAFLVIENTGEADDRLIGVTSDVAAVTELHTHTMTDGMVQMLPLENGLAVPAGESIELRRGGDHVMLMGIGEALDDGAVVSLTFQFEDAGEITVEVPVDRAR